ncbi:hypothetical protein [Psychroserpens sp.]|uniref:hypothetical protein n=1 Tax=Psychroserpens sp. TaxID=2020870 RepID=UPI002B275100|nr:hypothetical protein [Psychroserpens sp.]
MNSRLLIFLIAFFFQSLLFAQELVKVTESTIVLDMDQTKELFYSFAQGDEVVFDMEMEKGKNIKLVEIVEMPSNTLITEYKASNIKDKRIQIRNKGIYKFKFYSSSITRRVCKIKIHRIPSVSSTIDFNTNWRWETVRDTTYIAYQEDSLIGYQTINYKEIMRELKDTQIEEIMLFEKSEKVHSFYNENKSKTYLKVDLPTLKNDEYREENLVAWSYWIGVDQEGQDAYKKNLKSISNLVGKTADVYYQTPLAGIAVGAVTELIIPQTGEDVQYYFISDFQNVQLFYSNQQFLQFDMGKGRVAYGRNDKIKQGVFYIGLSNDNEIMGIDVEVKVLAVKEIKIFENVTFDREKEEPQYVTLDKTRMNINETKVRVPVE